MSWIEWESRNRRGRVRLYGQQQIHRFDKMSGSLDSRYDNAMLYYVNRESGERRVVISESITVTGEDQRYVYFVTRGRTVETNNPPSGLHAGRYRVGRGVDSERRVRVSTYD
jgi:hypothetical protein